MRAHSAFARRFARTLFQDAFGRECNAKTSDARETNVDNLAVDIEFASVGACADRTGLACADACAKVAIKAARRYSALRMGSLNGSECER